MTQPKLAVQRSGREYRWKELAVPSTTTIIGGGVPKDALKFWAARMAAEYAVEHRNAWKDLPPDDAVDLIKRAATRFTERKANLGDAVHFAIETYLEHEIEKPLNDLEKMYARGAFRFLRDYDVRVDRVESTVFSRKHGYAGTFDVLGGIESVSKLPVVLDWKTSKKVYDETSLQLCASARADFIAEDDMETETPLPAIEWGVTVALLPNGQYDAVPFRLTDEVFDIFLAAKVVADRERVFREVRDNALSKASDGNFAGGPFA